MARPISKGALDTLYKEVLVSVRGHDQQVLASYEKFVAMTTDQLKLRLTSTTPEMFIERWTLLKSRFGNRKHLRQYEMRTYFKEFKFEKLTGSTADTLLEYIQRNLPEGVAMHVTRKKLMRLEEILQDQQHTDDAQGLGKQGKSAPTN